MKLPLAVFLVCMFVGRAEAQTPTGHQLAEHLDKTRRPTRSFEVRMKLTELRDGKPTRVSDHQLYSRKSTGRADFDTITRVLAPEEDRSKVILTRGREVWLFDPKSSRPVSISPKQFRGKFFVADALSTSFATQYECENLGEDKVLDAARKERTCFRLRMKLREKGGLTPELVEYWLDKETLRVVRGQFFSGSGRLLRTAYYTGHQRVLDELRPMRILVVSGSEPGLVTDIVFSKLAYRDTPETLFTPEALPGISKGEQP